jgi:hypothetical protein
VEHALRQRPNPITCPVDQSQCFDAECSVKVCREKIRDSADKALAEREQTKLRDLYEALGVGFDPTKPLTRPRRISNKKPSKLIRLWAEAIIRAKEEEPSPAREREYCNKLAEPSYRRRAMNEPHIKAAYEAIRAEQAQALAEEAAEAAKRAGYSN